MSFEMPKRRGVVLFSAAVIAAGLLGGCRGVDPAVKRTQQAAEVLVDTSQSLSVGEQTVAESQAALRTLREAKGDLRPAFEVFVIELEAVRKQADRLKYESELVRNQAAGYNSARQSDIRTISNDDLRQAAEKRAAHVQEKCDNIKERYAHVNSGFEKYIRDLSDLQTYLANELNYGALDTGQRWVDEALSSGETLRGNIRELALQVELTSNMLSPVPIATTQWPNQLTPSPEALAETE